MRCAKKEGRSGSLPSRKAALPYRPSVDLDNRHSIESTGFQRIVYAIDPLRKPDCENEKQRICRSLRHHLIKLQWFMDMLANRQRIAFRRCQEFCEFAGLSLEEVRRSIRWRKQGLCSKRARFKKMVASEFGSILKPEKGCAEASHKIRCSLPA